MSELDRKLRHLEMLKRTLSTIERRIAQQEREISKEMYKHYSEATDR